MVEVSDGEGFEPCGRVWFLVVDELEWGGELEAKSARNLIDH